MNVVGRVVPHRCDVVRLKDVQNLQRGDALPGRRQLPNFMAAVVGADRLDPLRGVALEILHRDQAADRLAVADHLLGDPALVKRLRPLPADGAVDLGQVAVGHPLALLRCLAVLEERPVGGLGFAQDPFTAAPVTGDDLGDWKTVARVAHRRRESLGQRQFAEPVVQHLPAIHAARYRPAKRTLERDAVVPAFPDQLPRNAQRRAAAGVEAVEFF